MSKYRFPMVDQNRCNGCKACIELCDEEVFIEVDDDNCPVRVGNHEKCIDGCEVCKKFCMTNAIIFQMNN